MKTYECPECGKTFTKHTAYAGHISAHRQGLIKGSRKAGTETHPRELNLGNFIDSVIRDPRIIGDVAAGVGKLLDSLGIGKRKKEKRAPSDELERRVGKIVLDAVVRASAKQIVRQLQPAIRAQTELAVLGPELERAAKEEVASRAVPVVVPSGSNPRIPEPDHFISEEDVVRAWSG